MSAFNLPPGVTLRDINPPTSLEDIAAMVNDMSLDQVEGILIANGFAEQVASVQADRSARDLLRELLVERVFDGTIDAEQIL